MKSWSCAPLHNSLTLESLLMLVGAGVLRLLETKHHLLCWVMLEVAQFPSRCNQAPFSYHEVIPSSDPHIWAACASVTTCRNDSKMLSTEKAKESTRQRGHGAGTASWTLSSMPAITPFVRRAGGSRGGTGWQEDLSGFQGSLRLRSVQAEKLF